MTRPWTEAETTRLTALARRKVSAEDIARSLGRHAGPVKRKARELGVILLKTATKGNARQRRPRAEGEGEMKQEDAKREIIREWLTRGLD